MNNKIFRHKKNKLCHKLSNQTKNKINFVKFPSPSILPFEQRLLEPITNLLC